MDNAILRLNVIRFDHLGLDTAHELTFVFLVLAGCVLLGCERIAVAIKGRERD